jgi:23S rRNA pseudouridine1911/1915/1917 synthase
MTNEIVFEDVHLIVLHKPNGISTEALIEQLATNLQCSIKTLHTINRLDQRVSGLMLVAKNKNIAANLQQQLANNGVIKKYKAIVAQKPEKETATLTNWLSKNKTNFKTKVFDIPTTDTQRAILTYTVTQQSERYTMLHIDLKTGRFHQIRAQLAHIGSPIVGDLKYGYSRSSKDGSIFLQSYHLAFVHPVTKEKLQFTLPMPAVWEQFGFVND